MQVRDIIIQYYSPDSKTGLKCRLQVSADQKVKLDPRVCDGLDKVELEFLLSLSLFSLLVCIHFCC